MPASPGVSSLSSLVPESRTRSRAILSQCVQLLALAGLLVALAVLLQWLGHAYSSNFGSEEPDEPAHYVTGLMIRDYVASGCHAWPLEFAKNYYLHYPKVALGAWPPFFYVIEALWMLLFSASRTSVLLLSALLTVSCAVTLSLIVKRRFGAVLALFVAVVYVAVPSVQASTSSVMIDGLVALLELLATLFFAKYLDTEQPSSAYLFAGIAALAALTKANALALVLVPVIAIAISRRWRLFRRKELWLGMLVVATAAAPWNLFLLRLATHSVSLVRTDPLFAFVRGFSYLKLLAQLTGVVLPLAAVGLWTTLARPIRHTGSSGLWAAAFSLTAAGFLFHAAVPANVIEPRYLLPSIGPVLLFAAAGMHWMATAVPLNHLSANSRTVVVAAACALLVTVFQFRIPRRDEPGFASVAQRLAHEPAPRTILVSANSSGEGMAVAEIAMEDERPRHYVLRSTKVLSGSDWNGEGYRSRFGTAAQVSDFMEAVPVDYVLTAVAYSNSSLLHHRLLLDALRSHPERWRVETGAGGPFSLWERIHPIAHGKPNFSVDMNYTFSNSISSGNEAHK